MNGIIKEKENNDSLLENAIKKIPYIYILGNKIDIVQISDVLEKIRYWIEKEPKKSHWIVVTGMHGIMEGRKSPDFKNILDSADLFVPDGISLVWLARLKGFNIKRRVSGADLMQEFFKVAQQKGYSSFFYGDSKETLQELNDKILKDFPKIKIVGFYPSHFKPLFSEEDSEIIRIVNQRKPDILWVARGLPKQEQWIYRYRNELNVPIIIGVGAAFKFLSGKVKRAPKWMRIYGLEWFWRLLTEPKRVWRRVFLDMPHFIFLILLELFSKKHSRQ